MGRVIAGLRDEDGIKILSYLMLVRLASLAPVQVAQRESDHSFGEAAELEPEPVAHCYMNVDHCRCRSGRHQRADFGHAQGQAQGQCDEAGGGACK